MTAPAEMPEPVTPPAEHKHGNLLGDAPRVRLCGGPFIDAATMSDLKAWQARGASYGVAIDRLAQHAKASGFDPVTNKVLRQKTKNRTTPKS